VLWVYIRRVLRWRRNSYPFLTGDAFADFADFEVYPPKFRKKTPSIERIKNAGVLFCDSSMLQDFLNNYGDLISAKVIISGNSDFEFHSELLNIPKTVRAVFLQNSFISDNKMIFTLPIGIENFRWGVNGHPRLMRTMSTAQKLNKILAGPFGNTHPERNKVLEKLSEVESGVNILNERISPRKLARLMVNYRYVAAVRGNGVDTHRLWEALYRGAVPIIKRDDWSKSLHFLDLPIIEILDWDSRQLSTIVAKHDYKFFDPSEIEALWMPYWEEKIRRIVAKN